MSDAPPGPVAVLFDRHWFDVPNAIFSPTLALDPYARLAYCYLMRWDGDQGHAFPGLPRMVADTGMSRSTCLRALTALEQAGLLVRHRLPGTTTRYQLFHPEDPANAGRALGIACGQPVEASPSRRTPETPPRDGRVPQTRGTPGRVPPTREGCLTDTGGVSPRHPIKTGSIKTDLTRLDPARAREPTRGYGRRHDAMPPWHVLFCPRCRATDETAFATPPTEPVPCSRCATPLTWATHGQLVPRR